MSSKVTLTGHFTLLDGTPAKGTVLIRPSRSPILDLDGKQVISGPQRFTLDAEGRFSADLPPTDDPTLGEGFTYHVMVTMHHSSWQVIGLTLPADMTSVDVLDPPAGVVKEYPTRAEWDALTSVAVAEMEAALDGAETARDTTVSARDATVVARDETLTARDETFTARDTAVDAAGEAVTARDETLPARDETLTARTEATTAAGVAESARDTAVGAAGDAETARDEAVGAAGEAETARLSAWEAVDTPGRQGPPGEVNLAQLGSAAGAVLDNTSSTNNQTWTGIGGAVTPGPQSLLFRSTFYSASARIEDLTVSCVPGRKYYVAGVIHSEAASTEVRAQLGSVSGGITALVDMVPTRYSRVITPSSDSTLRWYLSSEELEPPKEVTFTDLFLIDLTEAFGAGREPSVQYMDELIDRYGYFTGDKIMSGTAYRDLVVAGQGMTLRHDNSVGERVFLDHPGGSTMLYGDTGWRDMSSYFPPGVTGTFYARRRTHATDVKLNLTLTAESPLIGNSRSPITTFISGLPNRMFPNDTYNLAPLIMREGASGAPTGTIMIVYQSQTASHMRVTSSSGGNWEAGTTIKISGAIPNDQPWLDTLPGTPN